MTAFKSISTVFVDSKNDLPVNMVKGRLVYCVQRHFQQYYSYIMAAQRQRKENTTYKGSIYRILTSISVLKHPLHPDIVDADLVIVI